jgi:hypothetical protein
VYPDNHDIEQSIAQGLEKVSTDADDRTSDLTSTANNKWHTEVNDAVPLVAPADSRQDLLPEQLLDGGNHFDDVGGYAGRHNMQRRYNCFSKTDGVALPRDQLHSYIASIGVTQPTP